MPAPEQKLKEKADYPHIKNYDCFDKAQRPEICSESSYGRNNSGKS